MTESRRLLAPGEADEIGRFWEKVVRGPAPSSCWLWVGAIADDGYGRFWIRRDGRPVVVRPHRYALALDLGELDSDVQALHGCDVPICCRTHDRHVHGGDRSENMREMVSRGRASGGAMLRRHRGVTRAELHQRSLALRAAVIDGWSEDLILKALARSGEESLF